ncbi:MAG: ankyrin repeat protein [uncultured bacterium]|nr:MAG: ankyrin repeat protein [uncultured bacterium]
MNNIKFLEAIFFITIITCCFSSQINKAMNTPQLANPLPFIQEVDQKTGLTIKLTPMEEKELFLSLINTMKIEDRKIEGAKLDIDKAINLINKWNLSPDYLFTTIGEKPGKNDYIINVIIKNGGLPIILRELIKRGANLNIKDDLGWTPLHHAVNMGNTIIFDIIQTLVENGADKNIKNLDGKLPIDLLKDPKNISDSNEKFEAEKVYNFLKYNTVALPAPTTPGTIFPGTITKSNSSEIDAKKIISDETLKLHQTPLVKKPKNQIEMNIIK